MNAKKTLIFMILIFPAFLAAAENTLYDFKDPTKAGPLLENVDEDTSNIDDASDEDTSLVANAKMSTIGNRYVVCISSFTDQNGVLWLSSSPVVALPLWMIRNARYRQQQSLPYMQINDEPN